MRIVACDHDTHAAAILAILNDAIVTSTALFDYRPRDPASMIDWFRAKDARRFPVLGAVAADGALMGFATYGTFRAWPAYKYTVEHSVYVHEDHRRKGVGTRADGAADRRRRTAGLSRDGRRYRRVERREHRSARAAWLRRAGTIRHAGFKFGRWLDLGFTSCA